MARRLARRRKVQGVKPKITRGLPTLARIKCADNTGARILQIVGTIGYKGRKGRLPSASVGDMVVVVVKKGKNELMHKPMRAIIIRQKKAYRRKNGQWIQFEDNAAVLVDNEGTPKGSEVKGPIAKEAIERWPALGALAATVV
ncbi:MAG TPA: 50S ribosomal protein L14 [Candidatus Korarchaeota archaeon]|nr:MAG: 50S ribosomal protein L14 [Candidatus Korarchaeota archaeon]HDD69082.1 50S ribosomal protein L14 [Candidatus Korarchaeota archaeon]